MRFERYDLQREPSVKTQTAPRPTPRAAVTVPCPMPRPAWPAPCTTLVPAVAAPCAAPLTGWVAAPAGSANAVTRSAIRIGVRMFVAFFRLLPRKQRKLEKVPTGADDSDLGACRRGRRPIAHEFAL